MRQSSTKPCYFDHNGECLICDCWASDCAYVRMLNKDYKWESKEELEKMFNMEELKKFEKEGYTHLKLTSKGVCGIFKFLCTTGIVLGINDTGYTGRYCYASHNEAIKALKDWDGEGDPTGPWIKYKGEGGERSNSNIIYE